MVQYRHTSKIDEINELYEQGDIDPDNVDQSYVGALNTKELGEFGEILAMCYLEARGYEVLEHHFRCPEGEADVVALDRAASTLVFVEVKTRRIRVGDKHIIYPEEAVDSRKCKRYRRIASSYIDQRGSRYPMRLDVVGVIMDGDGKAQIQHYRDVFQWAVYR